VFVVLFAKVPNVIFPEVVNAPIEILFVVDAPLPVTEANVSVSVYEVKYPALAWLPHPWAVSAFVPCAAVAKSPTAYVAAVPRPKLVRALLF
jgi:hypothetical protein